MQNFLQPILSSNTSPEKYLKMYEFWLKINI